MRRTSVFGKPGTQLHHWQQAEQRAADGNEAFLFLVQQGMTREELARNIERRPQLWSRFANWRDKLPGEPAPLPQAA